jgi:hypothetical protein
VATSSLARASTTRLFQNTANLLACELAPHVPSTVDTPSETTDDRENDVAIPTENGASTVSPQGHKSGGATPKEIALCVITPFSFFEKSSSQTRSDSDTV